MSERDVCDIIVVEVSKFMREVFPGLISSVRDELISVMDERLRVLRSKMEFSRPWDHRLNFREFDACRAPCLLGSKEPIISICWISDVESGFRASFCPAEAKVRFAECLLCDGARYWWCKLVENLKPGAVKSMSWADLSSDSRKSSCRRLRLSCWLWSIWHLNKLQRWWMRSPPRIK